MIARAITVTALSLACAAGASADTVQMKFVGTGAGKNVKITIGSTNMNVFAGQIRHEFSNGTGLGAQFSGELMTFCSELTQYVTGAGKVYRVTDPEDVSTPAMGSYKADALRNLYSFAQNQQQMSGANADFAAAFQLAVWEIVYDYSSIEGGASLNVLDGEFEARNTDNSQLSASIQNYLAQFFSAAMSFQAHSYLIYGLQNDFAQDQLVGVPMGSVVPLPGAGLMGLAGLGLVATRRRRD